MRPADTLRPAPTRVASPWRLAFEAYLALIVSIALGMVAFAPVIASQVRYFSEQNFVLGMRPPDDASLKAWALAQPSVLSFTTERRGNDLWFRSEYRGEVSQRPSTSELIAEMRRLGYEFRGMHDGSGGMVGDLAELLANPLVLAAILAGMQLAFGLIGLHRLRAAAHRGQPLPPLWPGHHARPLLFGVMGGVGGLALGRVNEYLLTALFGHSPPSPWDAMHAAPVQTKLVFLLFGALGAPLAEEIFFRGYVFGKFKQAGQWRFGLFYSSLLFTAAHFTDPYNLPCIFLFGIGLALLFHRTHSLLAPIAAHLVNNGAVILGMVLS